MAKKSKRKWGAAWWLRTAARVKDRMARAIRLWFGGGYIEWLKKKLDRLAKMKK